VAAINGGNSSKSSKFELKFQYELDNSTIIKLSSQQQILKCQVKLTLSNSTLSLSKSKFKTNSSLAINASLPTPDSDIVRARQVRWPTNVALSIDWLKDEQKLSELMMKANEPIVITNIELKSNVSLKFDKKLKSRVEIKNTLNSNQLKLTSRLKVNQLKTTDSGQYRCVARASFKETNQDVAQSSDEALNKTVGFTKVEQTLESNRANLLM